MGRYILFRAAASIPVLLGITIIVFVILSMIPGDPATAILGSYATPENVARLNAQLGLDRPLIQRYFIWLGNLLEGDLGRSFSLNRPVTDEILERFSATLILSGLAFVMCSFLGILAGVISATRQYGIADKLITFAVLIGISVPSFFLGMMMILYFAVSLRWLPASGMFALYGGGDLPDLLRHLVMPATALAVVATGVVARMSRSAMLEVLRLDFIRTARAKGVGEGRVIVRHALRHAIVGILSKHHSKMTKVVINLSSPRTPGYTMFEPSASNIHTREALFEHLAILLAGRIAEEVCYDVSVTTGAINDFEEAFKLAEKMIIYYGMGKSVIYPNSSEKYKEKIDNEVHELIDSAYAYSVFILQQCKEILTESAEILKKDKLIMSSQLDELIDSKYPQIRNIK